MAGRPQRRARLLAEEVRLRQEEQAKLSRGNQGWAIRVLAGLVLALLLLVNLAAVVLVQATQWTIDKLQGWACLDIGD